MPDTSEHTKNHNEHWRNTVDSLNLRGLLLAGMAVFIAYFTIRQTSLPLPSFFVLNPYLSAYAFAIVVCRVHIMSSIEPDMASWWDATIENAPRAYRILDYAMEGPWLFLLTALPFSCISVSIFAPTFVMWGILESLYLLIGKRALAYTSDASLGKELTAKVYRYYEIRIQHEILLAITLGTAGLIAILGKNSNHAWLLYLPSSALLTRALILLTYVEVRRNPWYLEDLTLPGGDKSEGVS